jgi:arylsulfatase A-like enzyme
VVLLVVDQGRPDYLERFSGLFSDGLRRLLAEGISFTEARHAHGASYTAVGHAALVTGSHPRRHGIVGNGWVDRDSGEWTYCIDDSRYDRSPKKLLVSTLGDWLKERYPEARVFSASGKDRAAVLLGGHQADGAFWFDREEGGFTTSAYYGSRPPVWLDKFNQRRWLEGEVFGRPWQPLPEVAVLSPEEERFLGVEGADEGAFLRAFPHHLGWISVIPEESFYWGVYESPFVDAYLAELAMTLVEAEGLGSDETPDLLALSFSALDTVGHEYGPNSREVLDTLLRLDRVLGDLLRRLEDRVGADRLVVALSSDHGVAPLPEYEAGRGGSTRRLGAEDIACLQRAGEALRDRFGDGDWILQGLYLQRPELAEAGVPREEMEGALARALEACPAVERAWKAGELTGDLDGGEMTRGAETVEGLFRHGHHPERSPDLVLQLRPEILASSGRGTTHGSAYDHDIRVPLLFWVPGVPAARSPLPVWTVDLAPTLAELAGVPLPEGLDGQSLVAELLTTREAFEPESEEPRETP